jgi:hypothetical protein
VEGGKGAPLPVSFHLLIRKGIIIIIIIIINNNKKCIYKLKCTGFQFSKRDSYNALRLGKNVEKLLHKFKYDYELI